MMAEDWSDTAAELLAEHHVTRFSSFGQRCAACGDDYPCRTVRVIEQLDTLVHELTEYRDNLAVLGWTMQNDGTLRRISGALPVIDVPPFIGVT